MLNLNKKIYNQIKNHAQAENPNECCGLLLENNDKLEVFPCKNVAFDTLVNFKLDYTDYLEGTKRGNIKAYYHSHASNECQNDFTELDKFVSSGHEYPLLLYVLKEDQFKFFDGKGPDSYVGKKFEWNKSDCLNIVELFYKQEFNININLSDEFRDSKWFKNNPNRINKGFEKFGFKKTPDDKIKYGDIIVIQYSLNEQPCHVMIYLGQNQILHQRTNTYSTIEIYNETLKQLTSYILRHKDLC